MTTENRAAAIAHALEMSKFTHSTWTVYADATTFVTVNGMRNIRQYTPIFRCRNGEEY